MRLPAVLVVTVYLAALVVALRDPSEHLLAGTVVLLAVCARLAVRPSATRSALAQLVAAHPLRDRRSRRAAAVAPVTPG